MKRKPQQAIVIGDDIEVSVLCIAGDKVRIGIEAPRAVPVFRKEIYLKMKKDRLAARRAKGGRTASANDTGVRKQ